MGCKITLVSECPGVADKSASTIGRLSLTTHNISCYLRVLAYDIDVNNTISNISIHGRVRQMASNESPGEIISYLDASIAKTVHTRSTRRA